MAQYYLDNLTGGGDNDLNTGTGRVTGATYTSLDGSVFLRSNSAFGSGNVRASGQSATADQAVTAYVRALGDLGSAYQGSGPIARCTDASNYYVARLQYAGAGYLDVGVQLGKVVGGTLSWFNQTPFICQTGYTAGDVFKVTLSCVGSTIKVAVNDVDRVTQPDTSHTGIGYPGLRVYAGTNDGWAIDWAEGNDVSGATLSLHQLERGRSGLRGFTRGI